MARARVSFSAALDSYAHDQGDDGTCYAHTVATLIISALRRMGAQAIPDRSVVLQQTISRFGPDGANTEEVLTWAVGIYIEPARRVLHQDGRLEDGQAAAVTVVSAHEVDDIVQQDEAKVAMCFRVSPGQWNKLTRFFERNPMGILSAQDLGPAEARRTEGHAVVIENLEDYDHGGSGRISSRHFWRIKNSWGVGHGTLGSVHVARDALSVHFYAIVVPLPRLHLRDLFLLGTPVNYSSDLRRLVTPDPAQGTLGSGTFGTIYRGVRRPNAAAHPAADSLPRQLVVKCIKQADRLPSLLTEMRHLFGPRRHRHIVEGLGATVDARGLWALVMRYYDRGSLSHPRGGQVPTYTTLSHTSLSHESPSAHTDASQKDASQTGLCVTTLPGAVCGDPAHRVARRTRPPARAQRRLHPLRRQRGQRAAEGGGRWPAACGTGRLWLRAARRCAAEDDAPGHRHLPRPAGTWYPRLRRGGGHLLLRQGAL